MMEGTVTPDEGEVTIEKRIRMGVLHQEVVVGSKGSIVDEVMNITDELRTIRYKLASLEERMADLSEGGPEADAIIEEHGRLLQDFERYNGYTLEARALKVLRGLGFRPEDAHRRWEEVSGGWRMRVALAKILLAEPDVLLLDEPTNHLDLESLLWVEEYLSGFKGALVLVSHDRAFLNRLVKRIVEVSGSKVSLYTGNYDEYERNRQMQEDVIHAAYKSQQDKIKRIQKFIDQNRVKARTASRVQSRVKMLEKMERITVPTRPKTVKFSFPQPAPSGRRVLEISNLAKRYGDISVYEDFNFVLDRGERIGLVGPNGAGKSTLLKIMGGKIPHDAGTVKPGHNVSTGYFAQHQSENLTSDRTVLAEASSVSPGMTDQEVRNLLGAFLFSGDDVQKKVGVLSGGEKSRLALTKILLAPPNLLLMDEPTNHLDIPSCEILEEGLKNFQGTLVLITHDRRLMNSICTGILEIDGCKAEHYLGNYDDYRHKKKLMEEYEAQDAAPEPPAPEVHASDLAEERESRKERKRREAQNRLALFKRQAPIKEEIRSIERDLEIKESRKREIEALMSDPAIYGDRDTILPLLEEDPILGKKIRELESRWEELHSQLEEIERGIANV